MSDDNLAVKAARASWACVQSHDKEGWLALMHDDVCVEDPIGPGPTNPTGEGLVTNLRGYWHMGAMRFERPGER